MPEKILLLPPHLKPFLENMGEVDRLSEIHEQVSGTTAGRKIGVEVLNKSAIVLLVACWESYVEELSEAAFEILMTHAQSHTVFPSKVLALASKELREHNDETRVWQLADGGWRDVLKKHRDKVLTRYTGLFNTPNAKNIDDLFHSLIGLKSPSEDWSWPSVSAQNASDKLERLIKLRGQIAHKVVAEKGVRKSLVNNYSHFVKRLAGLLSNTVGSYIYTRCNHKPWEQVTYVGHKAK